MDVLVPGADVPAVDPPMVDEAPLVVPAVEAGADELTPTPEAPAVDVLPLAEEDNAPEPVEPVVLVVPERPDVAVLPDEVPEPGSSTTTVVLWVCLFPAASVPVMWTW